MRRDEGGVQRFDALVYGGAGSVFRVLLKKKG